MGWRKWVSLIAIAGLGGTITGCGTQNSQASSNKNTLVKGGSIVVALAPQISPNWYFPELSLTADSSVNSQLDSLLYKPLIQISSRTDKYVPSRSIASHITWNSEGTRYTIQLNPKWHWSNGRPVTAQDVVFSWNIMKAASSNQSGLAWGFAGMGSGGVPGLWKQVIATASHTVVVTLTQPRNQQWFVHNGLSQIIPVPRSVWDKYPHNITRELAFIKSVANNPNAAPFGVVDGPFRFKKYAPNQYWQFAPNPRYDGHKPSISTLIYQYESSSTQEFSSLKTGTVDVGYLPQSLFKVKQELTHDVFAPYYVPAFNYIVPNFSPKTPGGMGTVFQQLPVRQAMQMGINQASIIHTLYHGYAVPTYGPVVEKPPTPFFDRALNSNPYPYNPQKARKLLEKNGWHLVNGVMRKGNISLSFSLDYVSGSGTVQSMVELLQQNWAKEGIKVHLVPQPFDTIIAYSPATAGKWAMEDWGGGWGYGGSYPTGGVLFAKNAAENSGSYYSPTMDHLINATYQPGNKNQILARLYRYQMYAAKNLPGLYIPLSAHFQEHAANIHNTVRYRSSPNYWYITKS